MIEWNERFEENQFPVDVYWIDIGYTVENMYFAYDIRNFPKKGVETMNEIIDYSGRRLVIIADPHIKTNHAYRVYITGQAKELKDDEEGIFTSIFIKTP